MEITHYVEIDNPDDYNLSLYGTEVRVRDVEGDVDIDVTDLFESLDQDDLLEVFDHLLKAFHDNVCSTKDTEFYKSLLIILNDHLERL
jgi:hypothetical protein